MQRVATWAAFLVLALIGTGGPAAEGREASSSPWTVVKSPRDLDRALARRPVGRPIVLEFTADWCGACRSQDVAVFQVPDIARALRDHAFAVRVDVTHRDGAGMAVAARFGVRSIPSIRFLDEDGDEIVGLRLDGGCDLPSFRSALGRAAEVAARD